MDTGFSKIPMVDAARFIGRTVRVPTAGRQTTDVTLTSYDFADDRVVLGLGSEDKRVTANCGVRVWSLQTKVRHCACRPGCDKHRDHESVNVMACELDAYVGDFAFMETDASPGPHRILAVRRDGPAVIVTIARDEIIAPIDYRIGLLGDSSESRAG